MYAKDDNGGQTHFLQSVIEVNQNHFNITLV